MKKIYIFTLILVSFLIPTKCIAEDEILELTLSKAIEMAVETSEDVQTKLQDLQITGNLYKTAISEALPHLNSEVGYNYYPSKQEVEVSLPGTSPTSFAMQKDFDLAAGVTLSQNIFTFGKIRNAILSAKYAKKTAFFDKDNTIRQISYNTAITYIAVLLAQESIKIAKNSYNNALSTKRLLESNYTHGRIQKSDNIKASADVAIRIPSLKNAEKDLEIAIRDLKTLIGYFGDKKIVLMDSLVSKFPKYNLEEAITRMYKIEPRLKMLTNSIEFNKYNTRAKRSELLPTLSGYANYTYFGQSDDFNMTNSYDQNLGTFGLMLKIPLWNGGLNWNRYKIAKHEKTKSELALEKTKKYLTRDIINAISEYELLRDIYKANVQAVNLSQKTFEAMQQRFASGGLKITELNDQEIQLTNAKLSKALTLFRINQAIITIERLISGGEHGSWEERYLKD